MENHMRSDDDQSAITEIPTVLLKESNGPGIFSTEQDCDVDVVQKKQECCPVTPVPVEHLNVKTESTLPSATVATDNHVTKPYSELCGWGGIFHPKCCQQFRNPKMVLFWLCLGGSLQGFVVNGLIPSAISTLEKRYDLFSTHSGFIASSYDIASLICLLPVSYFGGRGSKPTWIGAGMLIFGTGAVFFSLPQFMAGEYVYDDKYSETANVCMRNESLITNSSKCKGEESESSLSYYSYAFIFAQLLHGLGSAPLYTLGVTYMDECLPPQKTSLYLGIYNAISYLIGPGIGYLVGGMLHSVYVDAYLDKDGLSIDADHPLWVGAWWVGFLVSGVLCAITGIVFMGFPTHLPDFALIQEAKLQIVDTSIVSVRIKASFLDVGRSLKVILTNRVFMFINVAAAVEGLVIGGFTVFTPKFIESQFHISTNWASYYIGMIGVPFGGIGTVLGGIIIMKMKMKSRAILRMGLLCVSLALLSTLCLFIQCDSLPFAGVSTAYNSNRTQDLGEIALLDQASHCNTDCHCTTETYEPLCGEDGLMYFSPCYAGCLTSHKVKGKMYYQNCSCIDNHVDTKTSSYSAMGGKCESDCTLLPAFLPILGCLIFFTCCTGIAALTVTLRCLPDEQKSLALGIQWIIIRCCGTIPAPIIFGAILDISCNLRQDICGEQGSCYIYDNSLIGRNLVLMALGSKILSLMFIGLSYYNLVPKNDIIMLETQRVASLSPGQERGAALSVYKSSLQTPMNSRITTPDRQSGLSVSPERHSQSPTVYVNKVQRLSTSMC